MKNLRKVGISFMLMGSLAVFLWLAALAQEEPASDMAAQSHQLYLPLINNMGDGTITGQGEDQAIDSEEEITGDLIESEIPLIETVTASAATPTIKLNGRMDKLFGIVINGNHGWITERCGFVANHTKPTTCGEARSYRAWIDGPLNPYRYGSHTYFQLSHSENYRIKVPNHNWGNRSSWVMEGDTLPSARMAAENLYNNRHWLFSVRNVNGTLYGLTHHEWYKDRATVGGVQGFLASNWWIASIGWAQSTNGGASWQMKPTTDGSKRLIIVPQPSNSTPIQKTYGFAHPSNIVWDARSRNYYSFASSLNYSSTGAFAGGVVLLRTTSLNRPTGWEFWNGTGWTKVDHNTYQGNFNDNGSTRKQMPYIFWRDERIDSQTNAGSECGVLNALNVRQHKFSGKWIVLGSKWCTERPSCWEAVFSWTANLASPIDLENNFSTIQNPVDSCVKGRPYYSFFDVDGSADTNYQMIGNSPILVSVSEAGDPIDGQAAYYHQYLTLSGF